MMRCSPENFGCIATGVYYEGHLGYLSETMCERSAPFYSFRDFAGYVGPRQLLHCTTSRKLNSVQSNCDLGV